MSDYIVTDTELTSIANAIRTKGGTSEQLVFPGGFVDAVDAIETGSISIDDFALMTFPVGRIEFADATAFMNYSFHNRTGITQVFAKKALSVRGNAFQGCTRLQYFVGVKTNYVSTYGLAECTELLAVDLGGGISDFEDSGLPYTNAFNGSGKLKTLIIRNSSIVTQLNSINNFTNTPFASGKSGGTLYVPSALISSYQSATNWSTILEYENNQILPIEGSIYETQYADGTPII